MSEGNDEGTQRDLTLGIAAELAAVGYNDAQEIGRGAFGIVYRCIESALDRAVAVKVLGPAVDDQDRARFLREQRALGKFSTHPNIVQVLTTDITATGRPFLVMPLHARGSLAARIRTDGPLPWQEVLSVGVKLAGAMATAHACGVIHRDVNPANVLITDYGEPQLADFGIACFGGVFETATGLIAGTPAYIAPEVLRGRPPTASSDIYGLGATLFAALAGHAAFERRAGESMVEQFARMTTEPVPDLRSAGVPPTVCTVLEAAMATDPADRPATARDFGGRLRIVQFSCGLPVDVMAAPAPDGSVDTVSDGQPSPAGTSTVAVLRPPSTPSTRYRPPTMLRRLVDRPRLLETLRDGRSRRLVLIHGPAGFGKSTLAAQWAHALETDGIRVAWLVTAEDDNNVVWFLSHLVEAIRQARPALAIELTQILEERSSAAAVQVMTTLINEIHDSGETVAVVIDDWHHVTSPATLAAMEFLLDNGCHHLRLIVTSRTRTGLPLGRISVQDELVEIDESALRFDSGEAADFLVGVNKLHLSGGDIDRLRESTEGWVAALQLASLSLRGKENPGDYLDQISGQHYAIGEYLMENVVGALEPTMLDFVIRTAVTDTVCGDLAQALTGVQSGQEHLEEVRRRDLFLRSLDDELQWFRYHALFADFLRRRLILQHPGLLEQLHLTASTWFAEHGMLTEAVDHALAAGAADRAKQLVQEHADALIEDSRMATFLGLVKKLPAEITVADPRLQLSVAWANISLQRPAATRTALDRADAALTTAAPDDPVTADLRIQADITRAAEYLVTDRFKDFPDAAEAWLQQPVRPFFASVAATTAAAAAFYRFDFAGARRWHAWAEPYRTCINGAAGVVYGASIAGQAAAEQLDIAGAEALFRSALTLARNSGSQSHATWLASGLLGELLYQKGQYTEAIELLAPGPGVASGAVEFLIATYGTGARLTAVRGDLEAARQRLDEGMTVAQHIGLPRLTARIVNEQVRLALPITDEDRHMLEHLPAYHRQPNQSLAVTAELTHDSAIRLLLSQGSPDAAEQAAADAERIVAEIHAQPRPRALLQAQLLYGSCLRAAGRADEAIACLAPALSRCAELGLVRMAVDSCLAIGPVVETLFDAPEDLERPPRPFLRQVMNEIAELGD
ncbi:protein kinase [Nocardia sp. NEAU-G5]|uniref:Serine/threonine-protein kinase PknK n=1 Tax=Nocardia albiluteola TaxID=2842303 RepID=A0ABS6AZ95_9NOCA|nr:serine/threonine-protein kinase [Nocardia albiluteola]MBU3062338.1 protein kinase [Nocardia albiluteola]